MKSQNSKIKIAEFKETPWLESSLKRRGMNLYIYSVNTFTTYNLYESYIPALTREDADIKIMSYCIKQTNFWGKTYFPIFLKEVTI